MTDTCNFITVENRQRCGCYQPRQHLVHFCQVAQGTAFPCLAGQGITAVLWRERVWAYCARLVLNWRKKEIGKEVRRGEETTDKETASVSLIPKGCWGFRCPRRLWELPMPLLWAAHNTFRNMTVFPAQPVTWQSVHWYYRVLRSQEIKWRVKIFSCCSYSFQNNF